MNILETKNLFVQNEDESQKKGNFLLKNINFIIGKNEIHCLLGKNGSGKTTLANVIIGLERKYKIKGKIVFKNKNIQEKKVFERAKMGISLAFQEPVRFEEILVKDYLFLSQSKEDTKEVEKILEMVGLEREILERKMDQALSGGERKRIELASVVLMRPKLMILDEPDASLDIIVYNELYDILLKIKNELKCSILLITHREEAGLISDKASLIEGGRILRTGPFRQVMRFYCSRNGRKKMCRAMNKLKMQSQI